MPPTRELALWHCSDSGCGKAHLVELKKYSVSVTRATKILRRVAVELWGEPSEWAHPLRWLHRRGAPDGGRRYIDLPGLVGDALVKNDRTVLIERALRSVDGEMLRAVLAAPPRKRSNGAGEPAVVARRLSPEEQHQLLLLLDDAALVRLIDSAVLERGFDVPASEIRRARASVPKRAADSYSLLSSHGVRSTMDRPILELASLVWRTYDSLGLQDELTWRMRAHSARSNKHSVLDFIRERSPSVAVTELLLGSAAVAASVGEELGIQVAGPPTGEIVERLLWKLGFDLPRYETEYSRMRAQLSKFRETLAEVNRIESDNDRETIRAAGVNPLVSTEYLIESLVAYNAWLLMSDHFFATHHTFDRAQSVADVSRLLGASVTSGNATFTWDKAGANGLGTLIVYLQELRRKVTELLSSDRALVQRPEEQFPHYASGNLRSFAFRHTALWADADNAGLQAYLQLLDRFGTLISQADPAGVRNGIDHKRDRNRFPSMDALLACASRLLDALDYADAQRLIPKSYWLEHREVDQFGGVQLTMRDYQNRPLRIAGPPTVTGGIEPTFGSPFLVAPGDLLGQPNFTLVFRVREHSAYADYWQGYPRRRRIPPDENQQPSLATKEGEPPDSAQSEAAT